MKVKRNGSSDARKLGRHAYNSMCGGFGCLYIRQGHALFVITDNGKKKPLGNHFLTKEDDWGSCSLGPVFHRDDQFFLIKEDGTEQFLFEERCAGWQGGVGCLYLVSQYGDFVRHEIVL